MKNSLDDLFFVTKKPPQTALGGNEKGEEIYEDHTMRRASQQPKKCRQK
jgi:hypothetical protein